MERPDLIQLESAITAIEEAISAVRAEVDRDRLSESALARLATVEAELNRSRIALEELMKERSG